MKSKSLLDQLEQESLLSNSRYVEMLAHARAGKHGSLRLKADLREKGVPDNEWLEALEMAREQDLAAARSGKRNSGRWMWICATPRPPNVPDNTASWPVAVFRQMSFDALSAE
jgi:hypothetical protein